MSQYTNRSQYSQSQQGRTDAAHNNEVFISRFNISGRSFYFYTRWNDDPLEFEIDLTDGKYVWRGSAEADYIEKSLKPKGMETEAYIALVKQGLTTQDRTKKKFTYSIHQGDTKDQIKLSWNIKLGEEGMMKLKGTVTLTRITDDPRSVIQKYLDFLIDNLSSLQDSNRELTRANNMLTEQREQALEKYDSLIIEKQCLETDLYTKFIVILNEKKRKIRELKQDLENKPARPIAPEAFDLENSVEEEEGEEISPESQSQAMTQPNSVMSPSLLTFNASLMPTPSMDLLSADSPVQPPIRKRFRNGANKQAKEKQYELFDSAGSVGSSPLQINAYTTPKKKFSKAFKAPRALDGQSKKRPLSSLSPLMSPGRSPKKARRLGVSPVKLRKLK